MTSQRDDEIVVILTPFSRSQKDFVIQMLLKILRIYIFRPNLIDYINISKVLDNYMSRCKCTGGDSRCGIGLVGDISFSLKNISRYSFEYSYLLNMNKRLNVVG